MKELWQNERSKAGITLGLWGVFIFFIILLTVFNNKKISHDELVVDKKINENLFASLVDSKDSFKMTIESSVLSYKRIYDVTIVDHNIYVGYVEDSTGIKRFRCDDHCYVVYMDHEEEESHYYDELVKNINYLNSNKFNLKQENKYTYTYKNHDTNLKVVYDDTSRIVKIIIDNKDHKITYDVLK